MMGLIWFWIVALMLVAYVVLDGFDIGAGIAHFLIARSHQDRDIILRSIGPVWDGNEVWLLAGGGTLYFAFPLLYASSFSGFYLPLMIVLWLLILRGIGIELRSHFGTVVWRGFFDGSFAISSILLAIFLGAALANVIRGVPLNSDGYFFAPLWTNWKVGPNPGILDWYTVIGGLVALVALGIHGSLYLAVKTGGELQQRARDLVQRAWIFLSDSHHSQPHSHHAGSSCRVAELLPLSNRVPYSRRSAGQPVWHPPLLPQGEGFSGVLEFLPVPDVDARRGGCRPMPGSAAIQPQCRAGHHHLECALRPSWPRGRFGLVGLWHPAGHWIFHIRLSHVSRKSGRNRGCSWRLNDHETTALNEADVNFSLADDLASELSSNICAPPTERFP